MKKLTQNEVIERFIKKHKTNKYDYSKVFYINSYTPVEIICSTHGSFLQTPKKHIQGRGCPNCSPTKKLNLQEFIQRAKRTHKNFYDYSSTNYINNNTNIDITCPKHGMFQQTPANHVIRKQGCPECAGVKKVSLEVFKKRSNKMHKNFYDYSLINEIVNISTLVKIICPIHGTFKQKPEKHMNGAKCHKCAGNKKITQKEFIRKANEIHDCKYDYSLVEYKNTKTKVKIVCPIHSEFKQTPNEHITMHRGCPFCVNKSKISKKQYILYKKLKTKYSNVIIEHKLLINNNKKYFVDIFIPEINTIIEYYGDYWHCNPKLYKPDYFHPHKKMYAREIWKKDKERIKELKKQGYKIKIIWENKR